MGYFILLVALSITSIASGQTNDWAPVGAKWVYSYTFCMSGSDCGLVFFESIGDTTVLGKDCRAIARTEVLLNEDDIAAVGTFFESDSIIYMYEDSGKVHVYDKFNEEFFVLYDFNLEPGDTLVISDTSTYRGFYGSHCHLIKPPDTYTCYPIAYRIVDDTMFSLNGKNYPVQIPGTGMYYQGRQSGLKFNGQNGLRPTFLVEGIGATAPNMFGDWPDYTPMGHRPGKLLCYSINGDPIYEDYAGACQEVTGIGDRTSAPENLISVFPTITTGKLVISSELKEPLRLHITDISGRVIMKRDLDNASATHQIDLSGIHQGIFLITILDMESLEILKTEKLVISR